MESPTLTDEDTKLHIAALETARDVFDAFGAIATGRMHSNDAQIETMARVATRALGKLPIADRLEFLEHSIVHLHGLVARFGRDNLPLLRAALQESARSEPSTQPDAGINHVR